METTDKHNTDFEGGAMGEFVMHEEVLTLELRSRILSQIADRIEPEPRIIERVSQILQDISEKMTNSETLKPFKPRLSLHGPFKIGTAITPLTPEEPYHVDLICRLTKGFNNGQISRFNLHSLIEKQLEELCRSWGAPQQPQVTQHGFKLHLHGADEFELHIIPAVSCNSADEKRVQDGKMTDSSTKDWSF